MLINVYLMDKFYLLNVETPPKKTRRMYDDIRPPLSQIALLALFVHQAVDFSD